MHDTTVRVPRDTRRSSRPGKLTRPFATMCVVAMTLLATACGGGAASEVAGGDEGGGGLSLTQVRLADDNGDYHDQIVYRTAEARYWPELGFTEPADVVVSSDYIAGLVGGSVWIGQGESDAIWGAMAEGSVPLRFVGVHMDIENWILGIREGVDPDNLEGLRITGGEPGTRNVTTGEKMVEELGVDPGSMEWVSVPGGSEARFRALIGGQVDVAVLQADLIEPLEEEGGTLIYNEQKEVPQAGWVVTAETMEQNRDAVCAFIEGQLQTRQWISEGDDHTANLDEMVEIGREFDLEPSDTDLAAWSEFAGTSLALDGGAGAETFEEWNVDMAGLGVVPEGFDWTAHTDFSCLWEAQEKLGLEPNPNPDEMPSSAG